MTGLPESDRCYFCGGRLQPRVTTLSFVVGSQACPEFHRRVLVVKQVPAEVCVQCGEPVLSSPVARQVDTLLKPLIRPNLEVSVLTYEPLTPAVA